MVTRVHSDLVISRESVHEAEKLVASCGVHYKVILRQGKAIFWTISVDIGEFNVESPFIVSLFDKDYIGQPIGVFYFSYSFGLEEFANFFIDRLLPFLGETPSFLFDGFEGRADVQLVCDYREVNSPYILLLPGEYLYVLFQEVDEEVPNIFG